MNNPMTYIQNGDYLIPDLKLSSGRETPGRVRKDEENLPEGTPSHPLQPDVTRARSCTRTFWRSTRPPQNRTGADDIPTGEGSGSHRGTESQQSYEVGGADEHLQSPGRGNPDGGAYQQLTLNLFLSEAEQIQSIDEAENVAHTSSAFSFAQNDIDHVLRLGGNTDRQRERVVAAFEKQKTTAEIAEILKTLYHGGNGLGSVSAWYAEDGIHLSHGKSVRYDRSAQVISWESAAECARGTFGERPVCLQCGACRSGRLSNAPSFQQSSGICITISVMTPEKPDICPACQRSKAMGSRQKQTA